MGINTQHMSGLSSLLMSAHSASVMGIYSMRRSEHEVTDPLLICDFIPAAWMEIALDLNTYRFRYQIHLLMVRCMFGKCKQRLLCLQENSTERSKCCCADWLCLREKCRTTGSMYKRATHRQKTPPKKHKDTYNCHTETQKRPQRGNPPPRQQPQRLDQTAAKSYKQITETITEGKLPEDN